MEDADISIETKSLEDKRVPDFEKELKQKLDNLKTKGELKDGDELIRFLGDQKNESKFKNLKE